MVLVAPAAPASAYVNPYGRYQVKAIINGQCLTSPFTGVPGTFVIRANCTGNANQNWHFDRVGTWQNDPVFIIRATHRVSGGVYVDCLDLPYAEVNTGRPLWTQPCRDDNLAQQWRQIPKISPVNGLVGYEYASMVAPGGEWIMTFNNNEVYPHLVMAPSTWYGPLPDPNPNYFQFFNQYYVGP
jgi:hypothetical protein